MADADITALLRAHANGDPAAMPEVLRNTYGALRDIARCRLSSEQQASFDTTDLVHEAYLRLGPQAPAAWHNREQFFALASLMMRRILVNHARDRLRQKRKGNHVPLTLTMGLAAPDGAIDVLELDQALEALAAIDERARDVVVCRFFGGLSITETAEALGVSDMTVKRTWRFAKAWLHGEMFAD